MGTKDNPGEFDCYAKAAPDEPMFTLLARDKHAPTLVWLWATLRELDGEDPAKVEEARNCVADMLAYAKEHGRPVVGIGQAGLAAVAELIRAANYSVRNAPPDADFRTLMRLFLNYTEFEQPVVEGPEDPVDHEYDYTEDPTNYPENTDAQVLEMARLIYEDEPDHGEPYAKMPWLEFWNYSLPHMREERLAKARRLLEHSDNVRGK